MELLNRSLEIKKRFYGKDHPEIAEILHALSGSYLNLGDIQMAKWMARDAFVLLQDAHNPLCK